RLRFDFEYATVELTHLYGYGDDDWVLTPAAGHDDLSVVWQDELTGVRSGHAAQFADYYGDLSIGATPAVSAADALETLQFAAGIYQSAGSGLPAFRSDLSAESPVWSSMRYARTAERV